MVGSSSVASREQLVALGILSSLIYDAEQIEQRVPEGLMHEFPLIQKLVDEAEERGREKGIKLGIEEAHQEGKRRGTIESILTLLGTRFNPDAVQALRPALETIDDLPRLKKLVLVAFHAESLEAFMQTFVNKMLSRKSHIDAIESSDITLGEELANLGILSRLIYDPELIKRRIPECIMHEFPIIQQFVNEAAARGLEQGERKGIIGSILAFLSTRFNLMLSKH